MQATTDPPPRTFAEVRRTPVRLWAIEDSVAHAHVALRRLVQRPKQERQGFRSNQPQSRETTEARPEVRGPSYGRLERTAHMGEQWNSHRRNVRLRSRADLERKGASALATRLRGGVRPRRPPRPSELATILSKVRPAGFEQLLTAQCARGPVARCARGEREESLVGVRSIPRPILLPLSTTRACDPARHRPSYRPRARDFASPSGGTPSVRRTTLWDRARAPGRARGSAPNHQHEVHTSS